MINYLSIKFDAIIRKSSKSKWGYFFVIPSLIPFIVFLIVPIFRSVILSFTLTTTKEREFGTLINYVTALNTPVFWTSLRNTTVYTIFLVVIGLVIALLLSVLIFPMNRGFQALFKGAFYLPTVISAVVVTMIWGWMYHPVYGLFNYLLSVFDLPTLVWLGNKDTALFSLILMAIATGPGTGVILITAGMASIPNEIYDAAKIDGAGGWTMFNRITLPLIKPVLLYLMVVMTTEAFQIFTPMYILTRGGPQYSTISIAMLIYRNAFQSYNLGLASAQSILLFVMVLLVTFVYFKIIGKDVNY